jgi:steroid delta-isomerase-like uncharacterized protein
MPATPDSVLRAWFDGLWNRGDEDTINRLMHPDGLIHGLPTPDGQPIRGRQNFKPFYQAFRSAFPGIAVEVQQVVTQGAKAVAYLRVTGAHTGSGLDIPATGRRIEIYGFAMCLVAEGQVVEAWNCFDFLGMYKQLGADLAMPPTRTAG